MEYNDTERQVLSMMQRTDFKNLSKNDVVSIFSQLSQLRPDVAKEVLAQFPEFVNLVRFSLTEYKEELEKIIASDDESIAQVYGIADKALDSDSESRKQFYEFAGKVHADLSKCLDNPNLTPEERTAILDREMEIFKAVDQKDTEIRENEKETVQMVDKKDSEKRQFNWQLVKTVSGVVLVVAGISVSVLGGNVNLRLPKK